MTLITNNPHLETDEMDKWSRFFSSEMNVGVLSNRLKIKRDELVKLTSAGDEVGIKRAKEFVQVGFSKLNSRFPDWDWPFSSY